MLLLHCTRVGVESSHNLTQTGAFLTPCQVLLPALAVFGFGTALGRFGRAAALPVLVGTALCSWQGCLLPAQERRLRASHFPSLAR